MANTELMIIVSSNVFKKYSNMRFLALITLSTIFRGNLICANDFVDSDIEFLANMPRSRSHSGLPKLNYSGPHNARHLNEIQLMRLYRGYMAAEINRQQGRSEEYCPQNRRSRTVMCPTSRNPRSRVATCIEIGQLCSGQPECPGAEDEHPVECMFYKAIEQQIKFLKLKVSDFVVRETRRRRQGN